MSRPRPSPRWHLDLGFIFLSFDIFGIFVFFFSFIGDGGGAAGPSSLRVFRRGARPTTRRPDWTCHNSINRLYMTFFFSPLFLPNGFFWLVALCVPYLGRVLHRAAARAVLYLLRFFDFVAFFLRRFFLLPSCSMSFDMEKKSVVNEMEKKRLPRLFSPTAIRLGWWPIDLHTRLSCCCCCFGCVIF